MKCRRNNDSRGARLRGAASRASRHTSAAGPKGEPVAPTALPAGTLTDSAAVLHVDGPTEGSIQYSGTVSVGPLGALVGDVYATMVLVAGAVSGDIHAAQALRIAATATIVGDLHSPRIAVARGAQLRGNIQMRSGGALPSDLDELGADALLSRGRSA
jgi:hypothetical protein